GCGELGSACGEPASFCAQAAAVDVAKATAIQMNWRLARIRPPELQTGIRARDRDQSSKPLRPTSRAPAQISAPVPSTPGSGRVYARPPAIPRRHGGARQDRRLKGQAADRAAPP